MTKLTKPSGDGTPEDSIPTYPTPADKVGGGRPPKEDAEVTQSRTETREKTEVHTESSETGFAADHSGGQDPHRKENGGKLADALAETEKASEGLATPHASEDKGDQAAGTLDAEGEGDRGEHRGGGKG